MPQQLTTMTETEITRQISAHVSTIVTDDFLRRLITVLSEGGWHFSGADLETNDGRKLKCTELNEVLSLNSAVWLKAREISVQARLESEDSWGRSFASISFKKIPWYAYEKPLSVYIHGRSEGSALALENRLKDFFAANSEWYGFMSRGLWWWVLFLLGGNIDLFVRLVPRLFGARGSELGWWPYTVQGLSAAMIWGGRQYLFPATTFAIGESASAREVLLKIHGRAAKAGLFLIATVIVALVHKWIK